MPIARWAMLLLAILAQIITALAVDALGILGLAHAAGLLAIGLFAVMKRDMPLLLCVCAYLTGSEVLWRQVSAPIFYLAAPYLLILLATFAVMIVLNRLGKDARLALLYVALLFPAAITTVRTTGQDARELIAFALSGPLALAAFVAFTSQIKVAPWLYRRVLWVILISAVGPLTIAVANIRAELAVSGAIEFGTESNFVTSGGFGPVQVSSALSLGIMAAVLLILSEPNRIARWIAGVTGVALAVQTLLTFSRGGSVSVAIAVTGLALVHARDRRIRNRIIVVAAVALTVGYMVVFPWLEGFTGGAFQERFSDPTSSRTTLAANDTELFRENFVFGVGPGMTKYQRLTYEVCQLRSDNCVREASSHTEFTRMLGEHGLPGAISIIVLAALAFNAYRRRGRGHELAVAWLLWSISQMFYANLRIVAVPFAFGMAFLRLSEERGEHDAADDDAVDPALPREDRSHADVVAGQGPAGFGAGYGTGVATPSTRPVGFGAGWGTPDPSDPSAVGSRGSTPSTNGRSPQQRPSGPSDRAW